MAPTGKREIPTALEFMRARQPTQPGTTHAPGSAGAHSGADMPPSSSGRVNGAQAPKSSKVGTGSGRKTPSSSHRGSGRKQNSLLPTKGKAPHAKVKGQHKMPSMSAVQNRLRGSGPHGDAGVSKTGGRSGILSKFEGFGNGKTAGRTGATIPQISHSGTQSEG